MEIFLLLAIVMCITFALGSVLKKKASRNNFQIEPAVRSTMLEKVAGATAALIAGMLSGIASYGVTAGVINVAFPGTHPLFGWIFYWLQAAPISGLVGIFGAAHVVAAAMILEHLDFGTRKWTFAFLLVLCSYYVLAFKVSLNDLPFLSGAAACALVIHWFEMRAKIQKKPASNSP